MKAYLIARVSTEDQKDALPAQVYKLEDYAKRRGFDYETIQFHESAFKGDRSIFRGIISKIQESQDRVCVVFDKIDRFTRDASGEETRILRNMAFAGSIELHFCSDNLIINENATALDRFNLGVGSVLGEYGSNNISDNVKRRFAQLWRDGIYTGKAPYGYINTIKDNGERWIEPDPIKAEAVKKIFEWYSTGCYSVRPIRKKLHEEYGIEIATSRLANVIKNPFYMGEMLIRGKRYPHKYERLITEEIYDTAQEVRLGRLVQPKRWAGLPFKYRGLIKCGDCGSSVTFEKQKQKYIYGHCTQFKRKHGAPYINENIITEQLSKAYDSIKLPDDVYEKISKEMRSSHEDAQASKEQLSRNLELEISKYRNRLDRVYEDYIDEKISKDLYERKYKEYSDTIAILEKKQKNIELDTNNHYGTISHLLKLSKNAPQLFKNADNERMRLLVNETLSNLQIFDKQLRWELKKPYDIMAFCNEKRDWQRLKHPVHMPIYFRSKALGSLF
jgi:site-specific DNA recombinase